MSNDNKNTEKSREWRRGTDGDSGTERETERERERERETEIGTDNEMEKMTKKAGKSQKRASTQGGLEENGGERQKATVARRERRIWEQRVRRGKQRTETVRRRR